MLQFSSPQLARNTIVTENTVITGNNNDCTDGYLVTPDGSVRSVSVYCIDVCAYLPLFGGMVFKYIHMFVHALSKEWIVKAYTHLAL